MVKIIVDHSMGISSKASAMGVTHTLLRTQKGFSLSNQVWMRMNFFGAHLDPVNMLINQQ